MVNKLIDIISKEIKLLESYFELLEQERKMILEGNDEKLKQVRADQNEKLNESRLYNRERSELIEQIKSLNELEKDPQVELLMKLIDPDRNDRLMKLRETFEVLNDKIDTTRNKNDLLVERSRQAIMKTLDMLSRVYCPETFKNEKESDNNKSSVEDSALLEEV